MERKAIWLGTSRSKFFGFPVCLMNPGLIGREVREPQKFNHVQTESTGNEQPHRVTFICFRCHREHIGLTTVNTDTAEALGFHLSPMGPSLPLWLHQRRVNPAECCTSVSSEAIKVLVGAQ